MTETVAVILCLFGFQLKHFLGDFCLQTGFMLRNKSRYGHPGGILHALVHGALSLPVLLWLSPLGLSAAAIAAFLEVVAHYHFDWLKEQIALRSGNDATSLRYWVAVGADQLMHQATMLVIVLFAFSS